MMVEQKQVIPEGYKQTEVGIIPNDWSVQSLGELVHISSGESPSKFIFSTEGVPYFKVEQLNNGSMYADSTEYKILTNKYIPAGSVIFPKRGASILLNKIRLLKNDSFMDTNLMTLTCLSCLDEKYLYNILSYIGLDSVADTTSIPQINNKHIVPFQIPVPTKKEQTAIANALSDVDALIAELEKLIAKKQVIKTATMQQLLTGKTRLPQFALREDGTPKGYKTSELGGMPEDWKVVKFGDLLDDFRNGYAFSAQGYCGSGIPIITMAQVGLSGAFQFDEEKVNRWDENQFNKLKDFWVRNGDLLIAMTDVTPDKNLIGQMTIAKLSCIALLNQRVGLLRINPQKGDIKFFSYMSCLSIWKSYCKSVASLGVQANIGTSDIRKALVPLPEKEEQTTIATILSDMDEEIQTLQQRLNKTRQIKQGMMQELLTGKTRLVQPEVIA